MRPCTYGTYGWWLFPVILRISEGRVTYISAARDSSHSQHLLDALAIRLVVDPLGEQLVKLDLELHRQGVAQ